jgi:hypothetical protein
MDVRKPLLPWLVSLSLLGVGCSDEHQGICSESSEYLVDSMVLVIGNSNIHSKNIRSCIDANTGRELIAVYSQHGEQIIFFPATPGEPVRPVDSIDCSLVDGLVSYKPVASNLVFALDEHNNILSVHSSKSDPDTVLSATFLGDTILSSTTGAPLEFERGRFYIYPFHQRYLNSLNKIREHYRGTVDLRLSKKDPTDRKLFGVYPPENQSRFYYDWQPYRAVGASGVIVHAFATMPYVMVYPDSGGAGVGRSMASSFHVDRSEFDYDSIENFAYIRRYSTVEPSYGLILFDSARRAYYRVYKRPVAPVGDQGLRNLPADRPWSLIVTDTAFKSLSEICFPAGAYDYNGIITLRGGVAVRRLLQGDSRSGLVYDIFRIIQS